MEHDAPSTSQVILIAGMHRSGTSALAGMVSRLTGTAPKTLMPASADNRKGYWESDGLKRFHDALLQSAGTRWDDFTQFNPGWLDSPAASRFEAELEALLNQEFPVRDIFFVKDPRIARFLPFWLGSAGRYGIAAKIVIPLRNPLEVAASLQKRDGFSTRHGLLLWLRHVLDAEAHSRGQRRIFTSYEALLQDWRKVAARIGTLLEVDWPRLSIETEAGIDALISTGERHQDAQTEDVGQLDFVPEWVAEVYEMLLPLTASDAPALTEAQTQRLDAIRDEFDRACSSIGLLFAEQREGFSERLEKAARRADKAELDLREKNTEIQVLRQEIKKKIDVLRNLEAQHKELTDRLAAETHRADAALRRASEAEASLVHRFAELSDLGERYSAVFPYTADLEKKYAYLEKKHTAVLTSSTWRVMEPVRKVARFAKRRKIPPLLMPALRKK